MKNDAYHCKQLITYSVPQKLSNISFHQTQCSHWICDQATCPVYKSLIVSALTMDSLLVSSPNLLTRSSCLALYSFIMNTITCINIHTQQKDGTADLDGPIIKINQLINQSINQLTNPSVNQSNKQSGSGLCDE